MLPLALTTRQQKVLNCLEKFSKNNGYLPTLQELSDTLNINVNAVRNHLLALQKKKAIRYIPNIARGIELLHPKPQGIPILGSAPAGHPFMSNENIVDEFEIRKYIAASSGVFGIYVRGDSMKGAQLFSGDLLFVDPKKDARNGDIVVASVSGEPTIKRFYKDKYTVKLCPENKKYQPIIVDSADENFKLYGVVVGLVRALDKKRIDTLVDEYKSFARAS
jgi:repressor LexA